MRCMDTVVDEVKRRVDIVDIIGSCITLKKAGRNFKALCPFHQEKTPSFIISPDRQSWRCFGACQTGGDVIAFLMKWEARPFFEILRELAEKTGVSLEGMSFEDKEWKKKERLLAANHLAQEFYHFLLTKHTVGEKARQYLVQRSVRAQTIETFGLGYAPSSWNSLHTFLKKKGFRDEEIVDAGLVIKSAGGRYYDRFRKRVMFPLTLASGNIVGFSGRLIAPTKEAKYVNTPETPIYHKRETLFGIHIAKDAIKKEGMVVVVEGEFDTMSCFQIGIGNVVAVKGSAVTRDQLMLLKRYTNKIIICLDADFSGIATTKKAILDGESLDFEIMVARFANGKDPDEAIAHDKQLFKKSIERPIAIYDFVIETALAKYGIEDAFSKKNIAEEVIPFLVLIRNPIVKSHYLKKMSALLQVNERSIEDLIRKSIAKQKTTLRRRPSAHTVQRSSISRRDILSRYILHAIFQHKDPDHILKKTLTVLDVEDFTLPSHRKLVNHLLDYCSQDHPVSFSVNAFAHVIPKELVPVFDEIVLFDIAIFEEVEEKNFEKPLLEFKRMSLKKKIRDMMKEEGATEKSDVRLEDYLRKLSQVEKKLSLI